MAVFSRLMKLSVGFLATAGIHASPVQPRAVIDDNLVVGFPETVPSGTVGAVYEAYQPYLYVVNGCVPFPAVDAEGNTRYTRFLPAAFFVLIPYSGGLAPTGGSSDGCSSSTGQIYVRGATSGDYYGIMYAW